MPPSAAETFSMTHRQILTILGGLMMGMFLAALDQTIVATAIRTIGDDLHGLSLQAWVTTAYLITSTIATPLYGKLSDIYGRKPLYLISIALFLFGSLLSGTATSMYQLAGYRAVQGLGGGGLMSLAITILGDLLSPRERAKYQAYILAVFGTSSVLGPIIGGFFAGVPSVLGITGWRWIFLVNVPLGVAGFLVIWRVLHLPPLHRVTHRIDWPGALALAGGLVPLLLVAEQGRLWGWGSPRALACYGAGVVGLALFLLAERRAGDDALLPLRLFGNRTFSSSALINTIIGMGMFGGLATLPLYLQITKGMGPTAAGLALLPLTLGIMVTSIVSGQTIGRTGRYRIFPILGTGQLAVGDLRHGPRLLLPAARARGAERGAAARHGGRDIVVAVLPPDGRDAGDCRVPVDPVLHGGRQDRRRVPRGRADPGIPGGTDRPDGHQGPRERAGAEHAERDRAAAVDRRLVVHLPSRPAPGGPVPRRVRAEHRPGAARRGRRARDRVRRLVHAPGAGAAAGVRDPEPDGRRRRDGCRGVGCRVACRGRLGAGGRAAGRGCSGGGRRRAATAAGGVAGGCDSGRLAPDQPVGRLLEHGRDVGQHARPQPAVHQPVVEGQRQLRHVALADLALVHPRLLADRTERQDRRLAGVEDRRAGVDPEYAHVGDRDGAVGRLRRGGGAGAGPRREVGQRQRQVVQAQPVRVLDVRHDQPARGLRGDPQVHVVLVDDLLLLLAPGGVDLSVPANRQHQGLGGDQQRGHPDVGELAVLAQPFDQVHGLGDVDGVEHRHVRGAERAGDHRLGGALAHRPHRDAGGPAVVGDRSGGQPGLVVHGVGGKGSRLVLL